MSRFCLIGLVLILCSAASFASTQKPKKPAVKKAQKQVVQQQAPPPAPAQAQPEPPATPEHGPSSPPDVTFRGGQLTITARNSTLGDVLNAVRQKTGAAVDMPASSSERVVGQFGPGAPRDVMAQLLNGSHYDYVLMGSPSDPGALNKIVLMARANGPEPAAPPQQNQPPAGFQQGLQVVPQVQTDQPEDNAGEIPPDVAPPEEEQPQQEQPEQAEQPDQPPPPGQGAPTVKTPEELLRELQQQQQQQQQQNGQQPPQ